MPKSLKLTDYLDSEFMHVIVEMGDDKGWAATEDIAHTVGIDHEHPNQCVGARCSWLRRFGIVDKKVEKGVSYWRLTAVGSQLIGTGNNDVPALIKQLPEAERIEVLDAIARGLPRGKRQMAHMSRRTFAHYMSTYRDSRLFK